MNGAPPVFCICDSRVLPWLSRQSLIGSRPAIFPNSAPPFALGLAGRSRDPALRGAAASPADLFSVYITLYAGPESCGRVLSLVPPISCRSLIFFFPSSLFNLSRLRGFVVFPTYIRPARNSTSGCIVTIRFKSNLSSQGLLTPRQPTTCRTRGSELPRSSMAPTQRLAAILVC
jgi:hypothetical protein